MYTGKITIKKTDGNDLSSLDIKLLPEAQGKGMEPL